MKTEAFSQNIAQVSDLKVGIRVIAPKLLAMEVVPQMCCAKWSLLVMPQQR